MNALEHLTVDRARFLSETYGSKPEVTATGRDYSWLGSLDSFDHFINDTLLPSVAFRLVRDGAPLPMKAYTKKFGASRDDPIRVADPALVFDHFAEGATIILESMHNYSVPIRDFCRDLESELRRGTQVNAYITPPGARGFATHVDSHDVFVVQVHGTKHWLVHDASDPEGEEAPRIERTLQVGDCLYIPKGYPHSARTGESASAHLTIGILPTTTESMKREVVALLGLGSIEARGADMTALSTGLVDELRTQLDAIDPAELARRLTRLFFASRHHSLRGQLKRVLDAAELGDHDKFVTRVEWVRFDTDAGVLVLLPDRELTFTSRLAPALDVILRDEPFRFGDLPGDLDEDERRAIVVRLIKEGLLELR